MIVQPPGVKRPSWWVPAFGLSLLVGVLAVASFASGDRTARAAEVRGGTSPSVPATETINDDLYLTGNDATIAGRVTGDVIAAAAKLSITGQIGGSLQVLSGEVDISGDVDGTVRMAAGTLDISGEVAGDVIVAGGEVRVLSGGAVTGDLLVVGGDVRLDGRVGGDVRGTTDQLTIDGQVDGRVDVTADGVRLLARARIGRSLSYASAEEASIAQGATVVGETVRREPTTGFGGDGLLSWLGSPWLRLLCGLVAGLVLVLLLPRGSAAVADAARLAPLSSFLVGLVLVWLLPPLLGLLLITVVGAPIALIGLAVYGCLLYLSQVFVGMAIGRLILPKRWDTIGRGYNLLAMAIGVIALGGLRMIRLPFVNLVIAGLTGVFALGAVVVAVRAARRAGLRPAL